MTLKYNCDKMTVMQIHNTQLSFKGQLKPINLKNYRVEFSDYECVVLKEEFYSSESQGCTGFTIITKFEETSFRKIKVSTFNINANPDEPVIKENFTLSTGEAWHMIAEAIYAASTPEEIVFNFSYKVKLYGSKKPRASATSKNTLAGHKTLIPKNATRKVIGKIPNFANNFKRIR